MSTTFSVGSLSPPRARLLPAAGLHQSNSWLTLTAMWCLIRRWSERRAQRHALLELADQEHRLEDIGLTRAQAVREAARPFFWLA